MGKTKITALLLSYKRQQNLREILQSLQATKLVSEVIVWNNNPDLRLKGGAAVKVINSTHNFKAYARYAAAFLAANDLILFQDDDLVLRPDDVAALHRELTDDPGRIYGVEGRNLTDGNYAPEMVFGEVDIVLGRLMLFSKQLLASVYGEMLKLTPIERGDDIAFSLLTGVKHIAPRTPWKELDGADEHALWRHPDHYSKRQEMVDRVMALRMT